MNPAIEKLEKGIQRCEKNPATYFDSEGIKPILESLKACVEALESIEELCQISQTLAFGTGMVPSSEILKRIGPARALFQAAMGGAS